MGFMIGSNALDNCKIGSSQVDRIMLGSNEVWSNVKQISGTTPLSFTGNGTPLKNYRIYGANDDNGGVWLRDTSSAFGFLALNGTHCGISLPNYGLYEGEYLDYEEQKIYQIGNWLNDNALLQGYWLFTSSQPVGTLTSANWCVTLAAIIKLPKYVYTNQLRFTLRTSIANLQARIWWFDTDQINYSHYKGATNWVTLPYAYQAGYPYILIDFAYPNFPAITPQELVGKVWLQISTLPSAYHNYKELVGSSKVLPTITPINGTNTFSMIDPQPANNPTLIITGNINNV